MSQSDNTWNNVGEQLEKLGSVFRHHYEARENEEGGEVISDDEIKEAMRTLGESIKTAFGAVGDAVTDPDLQDAARQTVGSFFEALGATFSELGSEISGRPGGGEARIPDDTGKT
jgi:hypothetical protein